MLVGGAGAPLRQHDKSGFEVLEECHVGNFCQTVRDAIFESTRLF